MKKIILSCIMATVAICANAKDIKTLVVTTNPIMHCSSCEEKIKNNIRFEKGIKKIETNVEQQRVTVTYDADKNSAENIIKAFKKIGYDATECGNQTATDAKKCDKVEGKTCDKANGQCEKAEGKDCCKQKAGQCDKANGQCEKADGKDCCKQKAGQCDKANGQCDKAEGKDCCKQKAENGDKKHCGKCEKAA